MSYKTLFAVFLLDALHEKTRTSLIVFWGKALSQIPRSLRERQREGEAGGQAVYPQREPKLTKDLPAEH